MNKMRRQQLLKESEASDFPNSHVDSATAFQRCLHDHVALEHPESWATFYAMFEASPEARDELREQYYPHQCVAFCLQFSTPESPELLEDDECY
jgi:hypothetical protein